MENAPKVTIWGTGTPGREFLYVDDVAAASAFVMNFAPPAYAVQVQPQLGYINVGYGSEVTIAELAATVVRVTGYTGPVTFEASKPDGAPRKLMNSIRLKVIGRRPQVGLEEGLRRAYQDMCTQKVRQA